jgi:hypothetical protein
MTWPLEQVGYEMTENRQEWIEVVRQMQSTIDRLQADRAATQKALSDSRALLTQATTELLKLEEALRALILK